MGLTPLIKNADAAQDETDWTTLGAVEAICVGHSRAEGGKRFTPEEADTLNRAQDRATAVTGQITQMAAHSRLIFSSKSHL